MADQLVIKDDALRRGLSSLVAAKGDFDQVQDRANEAADACGHGGLAGALRESSSDWSLRRGKLAEALEALAGHMKNAIEGFEHWEVQTTTALTGDGQTGPTTKNDQPGTTTPNPVTTNTQPTPPAPVSGGGGGAAGGGQSTAPPSQTPPPAPGAAASTPPAPDPLTPGVPKSELADPVTALHPNVPLDAVPHGDLKLDDAKLEDLLREITQRWTALGGQEKTIIAALLAAGGAGLVSAVAPGARQAAAKESGGSAARSSRASEAGSSQADAGVPPIPANETDPAAVTSDGVSLLPDAPEQVLADDASGGAAEQPPGNPTGASDPGPEPAPATGAPASGAVPAQEAPPALDSLGSSAPGALGADSSVAPQGSPGLPDLAASAPAGAPTGGPAPAGAPTGGPAPAPLPSLAAGSATPAPAPAALPSLEPAASAEASMVAVAAPLGASMLHNAPQQPPAGAVMGGAGAMSSGSHGGGALPAEPRRDVSRDIAHDARRVLADLRGDSSDKEQN